MAEKSRWIIALFALSLAGVLFSGYLSLVKLVSGSCAFNETCPYFLGYPACWYGFVMYLVMFVVTGLGLLEKIDRGKTFWVDSIVSVVGILFVGNIVVQELFSAKLTGILGFSTCIYGFMLYLVIFFVSVSANKK